MNTTRKLPITFAPDNRFALRPVPRALARGKLEQRLEALRARLVTRAVAATDGLLPADRIGHVATEAAALAWTTPFPLLVLPELFREALNRARREEERQEQIRTRSQTLLALSDPTRLSWSARNGKSSGGKKEGTFSL